MTAIENTENAQMMGDLAESTEPVAEVKNATYLELAKATWKLAYDLVWGDRSIFCMEGTNDYLRAFGLPELKPLDGNMELADSYLDAWNAYTNWTPTDRDPANDQAMRAQLARTIRTYLRRQEPKPIETMNEWLTELGVETFEPPAPPRHIGVYHIEHAPDVTINSALITRALNEVVPNARVSVSYDRRVR